MKQLDIAAALRLALADIALADGALTGMAAHWELVLRWNVRTNLTAVTNAAEAAQVHYRDSLAALPYLSEGPLVDLGSGAGFPGLVLALARPQWQVTLVEPRRKRASFLQAAVARLGCANVRVRMARMEDGADQPYAAVVTRATFSGAAALRQAGAWLRPGGVLIAYRSAGDAAAAAAAVYPYSIAGRARALELWRF